MTHSSTSNPLRRRAWSVLAIAGMLIAIGTPVSLAEDTARKGADATEITEATQLTAREVFVNLPVSVLDIIPRSTRMDMADWFAADSIYPATNAMRGISRLVAMDDNYAKVEITPASTLEIRLLPMKKEGTQIMTVYTIGGGEEGTAADSDVRFFNTSLKELDRDRFFKIPSLKDFLDVPKHSGTSAKDIEDLIPFPTIAMDASSQSDGLVARLTVDSFMSLEDYGKVKDFIRPELRFRWDGSKMKALKE